MLVNSIIPLITEHGTILLFSPKTTQYGVLLTEMMLVLFIPTIRKSDILIGSNYRPTVFGFAGYIDDFCVFDKVIWDSKFTPVNDYLALCKNVYINSMGEGYMMTNGFTKVTDSWNSLSNAQKINYYNSADDGVYASLSGLNTINPFKCGIYYK